MTEGSKIRSLPFLTFKPFIMKYYLLEVNLLEEQRNINRELEKAYNNIIAVIKKISASLDDTELRPIIMVDHKLYERTEAMIHECITPYCNVSLGADETGYFNICYSTHYEAPTMIGQLPFSYLIREINRWTMNDKTVYPIEQRIWVHNLAGDVLEQYNQCVKLGETEFRKIIIQ